MNAWISSKRLAALLTGAMALVLAGCHTAGSMLVEVDVYKGPLGKKKTVQFGELVALFAESEALLSTYADNADAVKQQVCPSVMNYTMDCVAVDEVIHRAKMMSSLFQVFLEARDGKPPALRIAEAAAVMEQARLPRPPKDEPIPSPKAVKNAQADLKTAHDTFMEAVLEATNIATQLKIEAFYRAESQIAHFPQDQRIRSLLVGYTNLTSELSNQIASRTDTLDKQVMDGIKGSDLPLSDHLKDSGPTDFLHLYDWYQATLPDPLTDGPNALSPEDRARLARRLFSDHYWTRINQVYASGQGEVRMALIKDDIGNWNLKSFDNDPGKLLDAYRNLTLAGVETAVTLIKQASNAGGGVAALDLAGQVARGRFGSTQTAAADSARLDALRSRAEADLAALAQQATDQEMILGKDDEDAANKLNRAKESGTPEAQSMATEALEAAKTRHRDAMAGLIEQARQALEVHRRVVDTLKEMQLPSVPGSASIPAANGLTARAVKAVKP